LLTTSFMALFHRDLGFDPDHMVGVGISLPEQYKTAQQRIEFQREALRRLRALPGVVSATMGGGGGPVQSAIEISGKPTGENQWARQSYCADGYLETMRIPLLEGRGFSEDDLAHTRNVAIVTQAFASRFFGGRSPLGEHVKVVNRATDTKATFSDWRGSVDANLPWLEVIGVAGDTRAMGPGSEITPQIYVPQTHAAAGTGMATFSLRTLVEPGQIQKAVQQVIWSMDKDLTTFPSPGSFTDHQNRITSKPRFVTAISLAFAALGLLLASMGVYSVLSYAVSRRTQEIGIRMALGAQARDVRRMVMISGLRWLGIGIAIGVPASVALARILQNQIWGIKSADPLTLIAVSLLMTGIGLTACYFPARRATKVDPMVALRYE
jgi:predicted permease